jgi:hypothetical protein
VQVLQEARLVDRHQRAQAHRHGRELPEVRHQFRVRVRRQALAVDFAAEVQQLVFGQAAFQEGARVDAGRRVALDVQQVAAVVFARRFPEVVEADAQHVGQRGERGQVAAEVAVARLALTTMAMAFQRIHERSFSSYSRLPGQCFPGRQEWC